MLSRLAALLLRLFGWRTVYRPGPVPKGVIIVYPHTSNWDFAVGMLFRFFYRVPIRWAAKDSLFRWPIRGLLLRLGGVPINRRNPVGLIDQLADEFAQRQPVLVHHPGRDAGTNRSLEVGLLSPGNQGRCSGRSGLHRFRP